MHQQPIDDGSDLEELVVYADDDRAKGRLAQDVTEAQNMRGQPARKYAQLQQQLQSTRDSAVEEEWPARGRADNLLGESAKKNLAQQFEQSVAAEEGANSLQRLLAGRNNISNVVDSSAELDDQSERKMLQDRRQGSASAHSPHFSKTHRFGVPIVQHSSPPEQSFFAGRQGAAKKGPNRTKFAIREPQPAGLSLKASLQQLRGAPSSSQAQGFREQPAADAIMLDAEDEQLPVANPPPSSALRTPASTQDGETREPVKTGSGMSAQRNFLASVLKPGKRQHQGIIPQQLPKRTGRGAGMKGPLTGRLQTILQQEEHLSARGDGKDFLQVLVTEREQQGSTVTCRCDVMSGSIAAQSIIALFRSTMAVETHVGSALTICSPWRECAVAGINTPVIIVLAAYNKTAA